MKYVWLHYNKYVDMCGYIWCTIYTYILYMQCVHVYINRAHRISYTYTYTYIIYILYVYAYVHLAEKHVYTHAMQPAKQTEYIRYGCQSQSPTEIIMQHVFLNINMAVCMYVHSSILHVHRHILHVHTYMCIHRYIDTQIHT